MELGAHVLRDLNVAGLVEAFKPATNVGAAHLKELLSAPTTDTTELQIRQQRIRHLRELLRGPQRAELLAARDTLRAAEADVHSVATADADPRNAEYYTQILWSPKSIAAPLNERGWFTEAMVFFRTLFLPAVSVILPIFFIVAPLVLFMIVNGQPLSPSKYLELLSASVRKAVPNILGRPRFAGRGGALEIGEQALNVGMGLAVFAASIWNQISAATAMRRVVADMRSRAEATQRFAAALATAERITGLVGDCGTWSTNTLEAFGCAWNAPQRVTALLEAAGHLDALLSVALMRRTCFVEYGDVSDGLVAERLWHPGVPAADRVYNSVTIGGPKKAHVLLTGPNRGGKSTLLKSLGATVLLGQTLGIAFAKRVRAPVFVCFMTALAPADVLGEKSLFESEIDFARDVQARRGPMFLMMDEIFHGTNAHDGVEAAQVFMDDLYARADPVLSVISTHYMELPARYGKVHTQNLCLAAAPDAADPERLVYTYRLREGVNRLSSVREILRERGLLAS